MVRRMMRPVVKITAPPRDKEKLLSIPLEIGVVTSASFAVTALTNALIFWRRWDVDYFSLATPSDVVMSGFPTAIGIVGSAALLTVCLSLSSKAIGRTVWGRRNNADTVRTARKVFGRILVGSFVLSILINWSFIAYRRDAMTEGYNGLWTALDADLPVECRGNRVAWMGSNAALVDCDDHMRVVRDFDGVDFILPSTLVVSDRH